VTVTVLYVGGLGRSGSTLVDRMLGQVPGFCSVGELVFLWTRGLADGERCGCGSPLPDCGFWTEVSKEAFGGWGGLDIRAVAGLQASVDRNRFVPMMLEPWISSSYRIRMRRYADVMARVYRAIAAVSGAQVVVDSSKHVSTAALLGQIRGIQPRLVHLVRDPRAVAFSWQKVVERPDVAEGGSFMARVGPAKIAGRWLGYNAAFDLLRARGVSSLQRYEDVVEDPETELRRLLRLVGRSDEPLEFLDGSSLSLAANHSVAGNPLRFRTGVLEIRPDDAWRDALPERDRRVVETLALPGMARYGYLRGGA
jgi:hypothetical protein